MGPLYNRASRELDTDTNTDTNQDKNCDKNTGNDDIAVNITAETANTTYVDDDGLSNCDGDDDDNDHDIVNEYENDNETPIYLHRLCLIEDDNKDEDRYVLLNDNGENWLRVLFNNNSNTSSKNNNSKNICFEIIEQMTMSNSPAFIMTVKDTRPPLPSYGTLDEKSRTIEAGTATATVTSNLRFLVNMANANLFAWGGQIEELDYATSYMPTYGTIASRAGETVTDAGNANTYNSEEGVLFLESASLVQDDTYRIISLCDGQDENRVSITYSNQTNEVSFSCRVNDANTFVFTKTLTDTTSFHKFAISYKLNEFKVYIDGVQEAVQLSGSVYPANTLNELAFDRGINSLHFYGKTKQVQVFNTALSDFELKLLTSQDTNYNSYEAMRLALNYNIQ